MDFFRSEAMTCGPISSLESLINWSPSSAFKYNTEKFHPKTNSESIPKLIICHDMRNNYLDDRYYQGTHNSCDYTFYHWSLIDTFIYFSHHLVTIPTESWINAAHENNVPILGTFITEWIEGDKICKEILNDSKIVEKVVDQLISITLHYDFDGWLINIENPVQNVDLLNQFVLKLRQGLKSIDAKRYKTIWYDSVIKTGELKWQNELNELNQEFFNSSDGIFINYTWKDENLENTRVNSGQRRDDVYVGVDVFGRGCFGGGGFNCNLAVSKIIKSGLNVALFAPGWIHECHEPEQFYNNSEKFWSLLTEFFKREKINSLPILTSFTHSTAANFFLNGIKLSSFNGYSNYTLQTKLPVLNENCNWCFDDAFYAGSCLLIKPNSEVCLFDLDLVLNPGKQFILEFVTKKSDLIKLQLNYNKNFLNLCDENFSFKKEIINDWSLTKVQFSPNEKMNCEMLQVLNCGDLPAKLGLIKFYELNEIHQEIFKLSIQSKLNAFNLLGKSYFCVYLKWDAVKSSKYYNLFIDEKLKIECDGLNEFRYLGSTKKNEFRICFSLNNETVYLEPSSYAKVDQSPSFTVYIQPVDYELHTLTSGFKEFKHKFNFTPSTLKVRNKERLEFIDKIVYDLEHFELV